MNDGGVIVELRGVDKSYRTPHGPLRVLRGVDFALRRGEFVAVTGPSGSGKSTLLNLLALLDTPSAGRVFFEGRDVSVIAERELCEVRKSRTGMIFQNFNLLPYRTCLENVAFRFRYLPVPRAEARAKALEALRALGLAELADHPARLLSGGEMQRVAIARAIAQPPALLLADEPTGNLDRRSAEGVMDTLRRLNEDGITILLVTHNEHLLAYCSRHVVCDDGALREATA